MATSSRFPSTYHVASSGSPSSSGVRKPRGIRWLAMEGRRNRRLGRAGRRAKPISRARKAFFRSRSSPTLPSPHHGAWRCRCRPIGVPRYSGRCPSYRRSRQWKRAKQHRHSRMEGGYQLNGGVWLPEARRLTPKRPSKARAAFLKWDCQDGEFTSNRA